MPRLSLLSVGFIVLAACIPPSVLGQGSPCLATGPDTTSLVVFRARNNFSGPDSAASVNAGMPWAQRDQIYAASDSATCAQAVAALNAAADTNVVSQVYAVKIGTSGFLVRYPVAGPDGRRTHWLFDSSWQQIGLPVLY
jgi:hypothetical protein